MSDLWFQLWVLAASAAGFAYGVWKLLFHREALYGQMVLWGVGCMMFGRLFQTLMLLVSGSLGMGFHVGMFGTSGCFLFFFSANYGQMDSLCDDGSPDMRKYRILACIAPCVLFGCFMPVLFSGVRLTVRLVYGIFAVVLMQAAYFHMKHLIIPDVKQGVVRLIRPYNMLALLLAVLCEIEMVMNVCGFFSKFRTAVCVLMCLTLAWIMPAVERGVRRWTI